MIVVRSTCTFLVTLLLANCHPMMFLCPLYYACLLCINKNLSTCSRLLYNITQSDSSSPSESTVRRWIDSLNSSLKCSLVFSQMLASKLINRAIHIKRKVKNEGGRKRENFLSLNWTLTVPLDPSTPAVDKTPNEETTKLSEEVKSLRSQVQATTRVLRQIQQETPRSRKRTAKHYSQRHNRRLKKQRVEECAASLSWLENDGMIPVSVTVMNTQTNKVESLSIRKDIEEALNIQGEEISERDANLVSMMLYVKDRYNISGSAYHELASLCQEMPRHYRLKERIATLNSKWNIKPTPEGTVGVQQSLQECMTACIERLVSESVPVCIFVYEMLQMCENLNNLFCCVCYVLVGCCVSP